MKIFFSKGSPNPPTSLNPKRLLSWVVTIITFINKFETNDPIKIQAFEPYYDVLLW